MNSRYSSFISLGDYLALGLPTNIGRISGTIEKGGSGWWSSRLMGVPRFNRNSPFSLPYTTFAPIGNTKLPALDKADKVENIYTVIMNFFNSVLSKACWVIHELSTTMNILSRRAATNQVIDDVFW